MAGGQHAEDRSDLGPGFLSPDVQPVFAAQRHGAHRVFRQVRVDLHLPVFEEDFQPVPDAQGEVGCFGQLAAG